MTEGDVRVRHGLRPGDLGAIVEMHGRRYAEEHGFDVTFEAYVAAPLAEMALRHDEGERVWIAERHGALVGCVAVVRASDAEAQLRWFLVDPAARGQGLGTRLLEGAIAFARERGYARMSLWTVSTLAEAARLYRRAGFHADESKPGERWGSMVVEERWSRSLPRDGEAE